MSLTLAFDIYGTLIDTQGITRQLSRHIGDKAPEFSQRWRDKQLEYSFRRGLMRKYENFAVCTQNALDYTDLLLKTKLSDSTKHGLMEAYKVLPAYADVAENLAKAKAVGFKLYGFSNGSAKAVDGLLQHAGIRDFFEGIVSVDSIQTFKPNPDAYQLFLEESNSEKDKTWLISSNPFDVQGAVSAGIKAAWLQRSPEAIFDPWGIEPTRRIDSLSELSTLHGRL